MLRHKRLIAAVLLALLRLSFTAAPAWADEIERVIPPPGIELKEEDATRLWKGLEEQEQRVRTARLDDDVEPDLEIYLKAVRYALEHGEFFGDANGGIV